MACSRTSHVVRRTSEFTYVSIPFSSTRLSAAGNTQLIRPIAIATCRFKRFARVASTVPTRCSCCCGRPLAHLLSPPLFLHGGRYIPCLCTRSTSDLLGTKSVHCVCVCCVAKGFSPCPGLRSLSLSHLETNHPSFFTTSGRLPLSRSLTALRSATSCCPRFPFFFVVVSSPARSLAEKCLAPIGAKRSKCTDRRKRQIR